MTEEEIKQREEALAAKEREYQEAIANLEQDKANVVDELKAEREARRLAKEELEKAKAGSDLNKSDPTEIVEKVLQRKEEEASKEAFERAKQAMKRTHNEFSPETDTAGLVFKKFEAEMSKFNFAGLKTEEEFASRLREVYEHMNRGTKQPEPTNFYSGTKQFGSEHKTTDAATLSDAEARLIKDFGYTKEKYLEIKAKRPAYVASLLKHRG